MEFKMMPFNWRHAALGLALVVSASSCFPESDPDVSEAGASGGLTGSGGRRPTAGGSESESEGGLGGNPRAEEPEEEVDPPASAGAAGAPEVEPPRNGPCRAPVEGGHGLPARITVMSADVQPTSRELYVSSLYSDFKAQCGACHVERTNTGLTVSSLNFPFKIDQKSIDRMQSDDPAKFMPPMSSGGIPWSQRKADDPIRALSAQLKLWIDAGRPSDVYRVAIDPTTSDNPYLLSPEVGNGLTNLGNCVPASDFAFASQKTSMDELDTFFAGLQKSAPGTGSLESRLGLPRTLEETDLVSLDSEVLARSGVIAFAPAYPLWSDDAGKLRHVRVPRGKSIRFDAETQSFSIPPNTRFYKTFFKDVIDSDGTRRARKMETRLIVSRPDGTRPDGSREIRALFGTYKWNEEETRATLLTVGLRSGEPFKDELVTYITDEPRAAAIRATNPLNLTYEFEFQKVMRRYAIPGSERCVQCHMGTSDFILGFTPMQIHRRPEGEGGVFEPAGDDELAQLERLVGLGVVTGIESSDDIVLLEDSQGERKPRNDYELRAQAYMLGNCAHCHNPIGYPSTAAPELASIVNFLPSRDGGIFQFPLERVSPRITRGLVEQVPIPYITPSLRDLIPLSFDSSGYKWRQKLSASSADVYINAPWRSLIFRNVHTPFTYADDYTIFPHMPFNTPGFDCRAARMLGEWMVSIPARSKHPELDEDYMPGSNSAPAPGAEPEGEYLLIDHEPQPYIEVKPTERAFNNALQAAEGRLERFRRDRPYTTCPDASDIVIPSVLRGQTSPSDDLEGVTGDGVPERPHFVETDLSQPPGPWEPRRSDWNKVLVEGIFPAIEPGKDYATRFEAQQKERKVVETLQGVALTPNMKSFAAAPFPFALWKEKAECNLASVPKVASFGGLQRPRWMDTLPPSAAESPVYSPSPGAAVFNMICVNCHGREADSLGRQADTVQTLSGGLARVANLRDGVFDLKGTPTNRDRVFAPFANSSAKTEDWMARYLAWMALGGTQVLIPPAVLDVVARTDVAGTRRKEALIASPTPNMLESAATACSDVLPARSGFVNLIPFDINGGSYALKSGATRLITTNGDAELWQKLCSMDNPPPVRVIDRAELGGINPRVKGLFRASSYAATAAVGNHQRQIVNGVQPDNLFPWCLQKPLDELEAFEKFRTDFAIGGQALPVCPDGLVVLTEDEINAWATRGAINAGLAVYVYLDKLTRGEVKPVAYDQCELLTPP